MREDLWIEDEDDGRRRPRSVLAILVIAAIPWVIVAAIVLLPDRNERDSAGSGGEAAAGESEHNDDAGPQRQEGPTDPERTEDVGSDHQDGALDGRDVAPFGRDEPPTDGHGLSNPAGADDQGVGSATSTDLALAATATVVARAWATGVDPRLDVPGVDPEQRPRYAEHVAVESIDHASSGLAVVTLVAVVLEELDEGLGADLRRIAVPLAVVDGSPRLAGMPWWLPPPAIQPAEVEVEAVVDPTLLASAADALQHAGYDDVEVSVLYRTAEWPWIAGFTALAPGREQVSGEVWLRQEHDRFVLAGHLPDDARRDGGPS